jgi:8-oxo-dGTP pyrophosphatase MutT (NUDIX family)
LTKKQFGPKKMGKYASIIVMNHFRQVLLLMRGRTAPWKPLSWDIPGGAQEGYETALHTALRELQEEAGPNVRRMVDGQGRSLKFLGSSQYDEIHEKCKSSIYFAVQLNSTPQIKLGQIHENGQTLCRNRATSKLEWVHGVANLPITYTPILEHEKFQWCSIDNLPPQQELAVDREYIIKAVAEFSKEPPSSK